MDKGKKEPRARRTFTPEYKEGAGRLVLDESRLRKENRELRMERELLQNHPEGFRSVEPETPGVLWPLLSGRSDRLLFGDARAR